MSRLRQLPDAIMAAGGAGILILAVGLVALVAGQLWLFPSLGPTAYMQAQMPQQAGARAYAVVVGHAIGVVSAVAGVFVTGAGSTPPALAADILAPQRVWASAIAIALLIMGERLAKASHPPAAATALLITLGGFSISPKDMIAIAAGVLALTVLGEPVRRIRAKAAA